MVTYPDMARTAKPNSDALTTTAPVDVLAANAPTDTDSPSIGILENVGSILDLVPRLKPEWGRPEHLATWCKQIESALDGGVRAMCSIPIQHYKTSTTLIGVAWLLRKKPQLRIILLTYSFDKAQSVAKELREICQAAGIGPRAKFNKIDEWQNEAGGGVVVMSAEQSKLGYPCDVLLVDDPLDEDGAADGKRRDRVDDKISHYTARANMRRGSVLIVASRWHPDDPIGRRLLRTAVKWSYDHKPGILDYGTPQARAFAPSVLTLEQHEQLRKEWFESDPAGRKWWAQVQNDPLPDSLGLFKNPQRYQVLPQTPCRVILGLDLAYSSARRSDYFALVAIKIYVEQFIALEPGPTGDPVPTSVVGQRGYVVNAWREKYDPAQAEQIIKLARGMYPGAVAFSYASGPELGTFHYLMEHGIPVQIMPARYGKRTRGQKTIDRCNSGRIVFPETGAAPWVSGMVSRMILFTGDEAAGDDDEIDALVSACDGGMFSSVTSPKSLGAPRIGRNG